MLPAIISDTIEKQTPCIFISPHLDDAVLSCGGLLSFLAGKTSVSVVTLFTEAGPPPHTLSGREFLRQCHVGNAERLFAGRKKEDRSVLEGMGIEAIHLGFPDALWRRIEQPRWWRRGFAPLLPELIHRYPTYRFHVASGRISPKDEDLLRSVRKELKSLRLQNESAMIFGPLALGNHVDHVITRDMVRELSGPVMLWEDFPYNLTFHVEESSSKYEKFFTWEEGIEKKKDLIFGYRTQATTMFPKGIPSVPESYYQKQEIKNNRSTLDISPQTSV
jgi:LmbE family N-acetylglucosaminyl deacetylase